jgi:hypothetical protein
MHSPTGGGGGGSPMATNFSTKVSEQIPLIIIFNFIFKFILSPLFYFFSRSTAKMPTLPCIISGSSGSSGPSRRPLPTNWAALSDRQAFLNNNCFLKMFFITPHLLIN